MRITLYAKWMCAKWISDESDVGGLYSTSSTVGCTALACRASSARAGAHPIKSDSVVHSGPGAQVFLRARRE